MDTIKTITSTNLPDDLFCNRCLPNKCNRSKALCTECRSGFFGSKCQYECPSGKYGKNCLSECPSTCVPGSTCHYISGECHDGCAAGYSGKKCNETCTRGFYGENCLKNCSSNCLDLSCDRFSGECVDCKLGHSGLFCNNDHSFAVDDNNSFGPTSTVVVVSVVGIFALGIIVWSFVACVTFLKHRMIRNQINQTKQEAPRWVTKNSIYRGNVANIPERKKRKVPRKKRKKKSIQSAKNKNDFCSRYPSLKLKPCIRDTDKKNGSIFLNARTSLSQGESNGVDILSMDDADQKVSARQLHDKMPGCSLISKKELTNLQTPSFVINVDQNYVPKQKQASMKSIRVLPQTAISDSISSSEAHPCKKGEESSTAVISSEITSDLSSTSVTEEKTTSGTESDNDTSIATDWSSDTAINVTPSEYTDNVSESTAQNTTSYGETTRTTDTTQYDSDEDTLATTTATNLDSSAISYKPNSNEIIFSNERKENLKHTNITTDKRKPKSHQNKISFDLGDNAHKSKSANDKTEDLEIPVSFKRLYNVPMMEKMYSEASDRVTNIPHLKSGPAQMKNPDSVTNDLDIASSPTSRLKSFFGRLQAYRARAPPRLKDEETSPPAKHFSHQFLLGRLALWQDGSRNNVSLGGKDALTEVENDVFEVHSGSGK